MPAHNQPAAAATAQGTKAAAAAASPLPVQDAEVVPPARALARPAPHAMHASTELAQRDAGVAALAAMSDQEFDQRLRELVTYKARIEKIVDSVMQRDVDYGFLEGVKKPALYKAGGETLSKIFKLVALYRVEDLGAPGDPARPPVRYRVTATVHLGSEAGPIVGEGVGSASSWEDKHRWRYKDPACPLCKAETIRTSSFKPGYYCNRKAGGCGAEFGEGDPAIKSQAVGKKENPNQFELENTVLKMAKKRAYVDGMLTATGTSGRFTQDVEDLKPGDVQDKGRPAAAGGGNAAPRAAGPEPTRASGTDPNAPHPALPCPLPPERDGDAALVYVGADLLPHCLAHRWALRKKDGKYGEFYSCGKKEGAKWCGAAINGDVLRRAIESISKVSQRAEPEGIDPRDTMDPDDIGPGPGEGDDFDWDSYDRGEEPAPPRAAGPGGPETTPLQRALAALRATTRRPDAERVVRDSYPDLAQPARDELRRALGAHLKAIR